MHIPAEARQFAVVARGGATTHERAGIDGVVVLRLCLDVIVATMYH